MNLSRNAAGVRFPPKAAAKAEHKNLSYSRPFVLQDRG
jgi:hypothetical protein